MNKIKRPDPETLTDQLNRVWDCLKELFYQADSNTTEMKMAQDVLSSDSHYADSLRKNIRSFYGAIEDGKKLQNEINILKAENEELRDKIYILELQIKELRGYFFSEDGHFLGEKPPVSSTNSLKK